MSHQLPAEVYNSIEFNKNQIGNVVVPRTQTAGNTINTDVDDIPILIDESIEKEERTKKGVSDEEEELSEMKQTVMTKKIDELSTMRQQTDIMKEVFAMKPAIVSN